MPADSSRRVIVGKAVLLPLLLEYFEDKSLWSLLDRKYFHLAFLDQQPSAQTHYDKLDFLLKA